MNNAFINYVILSEINISSFIFIETLMLSRFVKMIEGDLLRRGEFLIQEVHQMHNHRF
jgi:hypothetical protein